MLRSFSIVVRLAAASALAAGCAGAPSEPAGGANAAEARPAETRAAGSPGADPIEVEPVVVGRQPISIRTSGKAAFNQDRLSYVSSPLVGRVVKILARPGDVVEAGQLLAIVDSAELGAASSEFIKARADLVQARRAFALARDLSEAKALARKDLQRAEDKLVKAGADLRRTRERLLSLGITEAELDRPLNDLHVRSEFPLAAPLHGTVIDRQLTLGQMVGGDSDKHLYVIADLSALWVVADVYEKDLPLVRSGEEVTIEPIAWPGEKLHGAIEYVGDVVEAATRTVKVRVAVDNAGLRLKPEMFVNVVVQTQSEAPVLSIPLAALHGEGQGAAYAFVASDHGRFARRPIVIGDKFDDRVVVVSGLEPQARVAARGSILLEAGGAGQPTVLTR